MEIPVHFSMGISNQSITLLVCCSPHWENLNKAVFGNFNLSSHLSSIHFNFNLNFLTWMPFPKKMFRAMRRSRLFHLNSQPTKWLILGIGYWNTWFVNSVSSASTTSFTSVPLKLEKTLDRMLAIEFENWRREEGRNTQATKRIWCFFFFFLKKPWFLLGKGNEGKKKERKITQLY